MDWREIRVPLLAAIALCVAGLVLGALLGSAVSSRSTETANLPAGSPANAGRATRFADNPSEETSRVVLGNIATVPFQELYSVLSSRSPAELTEVSEQIKALPAGHEKEQKIRNFFKAWSHFDAIGALKAAADLESPASRDKAISAVIEGADSAAAESLAKTIASLPADSLPPNRQRGLAGLAAVKWSEVDPAAAATFIDSVPVPAAGSVFADIHTVAMNWAAVDPQAAMSWAQQHDSSQNYPTHFGVSGAISGWWQKDPGAAEAYVTSHLGSVADRQLASTLASQIFNSDPNRAIEFVNALPDVEARRQADSVLANQMAWSDPKTAAEWAVGLPNDVRSTVVNSAVSTWVQSNAPAAAEWLGTLNGSVRDQAINAYVSGVAFKDPANALNWADAISDPQMRDTSVDRVVRTWMQRDPQQATAWLQASSLPADAKQRLLATATPPPGG